MKKMSVMFLVMLLAGISTVFTGCNKKGTANAGPQAPGVVTQETIAEPEGTTFGSYPADYGIAYFSMLGIAPAPTVRGLFGPETAFVTSFGDVPATVTLEKTTASEKEFTGQLLLTLHVPEKGDMKTFRLQVTFVSDDMSEMSYCRYVNLVNLMDGSRTEQRSYGDQNSDGKVLGIFAGVLEYFWDMSKLNG
ncbi:MAG: hypothetical protein LBL44_04580 [Treponema sp.]|jgi:hypothetical protein|nr:hypothetical protein [Treponema sp.]